MGALAAIPPAPLAPLSCRSHRPGVHQVALAIEVSPTNEAAVLAAMQAAGVPCARVGTATADKRVAVKAGGQSVLEASMSDLRDVWEVRGSLGTHAAT